jgi:hypothetical protein
LASSGIAIDSRSIIACRGRRLKCSYEPEQISKGWNEDRVKRVLAHYGKQTDADAVPEDEAAFESSGTVMTVPRELVPKVRELIAKHQS